MLLQQARTRAVLAALSIPIWVARREPVQSIAAVSVWNRQAELVDDQYKVAQPIVNSPVESTIMESSPSTLVSNEAEKIRPQIDLNSNKLSLLNKTVRQPFEQTIVASETVHVVQVLRFSLEARVIGNWIVLVSVQALNHPDRNALWKNLNQALVSDNRAHDGSRLDWPLAEGAKWQHNDGAQAALMGFLSRFGTDRRIGLMGELPDSVIPERLERLPSLDELLQEPLKKRTLWKLLTGSIR